MHSFIIDRRRLLTDLLNVCESAFTSYHLHRNVPVDQAYVRRVVMKLDELMHELIWVTYLYLTIEL